MTALLESVNQNVIVACHKIAKISARIMTVQTKSKQNYK